MDTEASECFRKCHNLYPTLDPRRVYCKKGCSSDSEEFEKCLEETCQKVCVKTELGSDDSKWGSWSKILSRAPADSQDCLNACEFGCANK